MPFDNIVFLFPMPANHTPDTSAVILDVPTNEGGKGGYTMVILPKYHGLRNIVIRSTVYWSVLQHVLRSDQKFSVHFTEKFIARSRTCGGSAPRDTIPEDVEYFLPYGIYAFDNMLRIHIYS